MPTSPSVNTTANPLWSAVLKDNEAAAVTTDAASKAVAAIEFATFALTKTTVIQVYQLC